MTTPGPLTPLARRHPFLLPARRRPQMGPPPTPNRATHPFVGTIDFRGIRVNVENAPGSIRSGKDRDGNAWRCRMPHWYGEISGTTGLDGDRLDVFVGPDEAAASVYVIRQHDGDGFPDEDKVMLGFPTREAAEAGYRASYTPGFARVDDVITMPFEQFVEWLRDPANRGTPVQGGPVGGHRGLLIKAEIPAGTVHTWRDGLQYQKQGDGSWKLLGDAARPQVGDKIPVAYNARIFGWDKPADTYRVVSVAGGNVKLSCHAEGADYGPTMPIASLRHFRDDLAGVVRLPPSGNPAIDAVTSGQAKLLGKGDDGIAYRVGDHVVKVSTTVPYQPENPGHRSPQEASDQLRKQVEMGNKLAELGVPGIQRSTFVQHGDKGFQIKPWVEIPEKLTRDQLDQVQRSILSMHEHGYCLHDQPQAGIEPDGRLVMFDIGKAGPDQGGEGIYADKVNDIDNLRTLYQRNGERFVRLDRTDGQRRLDKVREWLDRPKIPGRMVKQALQDATREIEEEGRHRGPAWKKQATDELESLQAEWELLGGDEISKGTRQGGAVLFKSKLPAGTVHTWRDGLQYQKQGDGSWKPLGDPRQTSLLDLPEPVPPPPPEPAGSVASFPEGTRVEPTPAVYDLTPEMADRWAGHVRGIVKLLEAAPLHSTYDRAWTDAWHGADTEQEKHAAADAVQADWMKRAAEHDDRLRDASHALQRWTTEALLGGHGLHLEEGWDRLSTQQRFVAGLASELAGELDRFADSVSSETGRRKIVPVNDERARKSVARIKRLVPRLIREIRATAAEQAETPRVRATSDRIAGVTVTVETPASVVDRGQRTWGNTEEQVAGAWRRRNSSAQHILESALPEAVKKLTAGGFGRALRGLHLFLPWTGLLLDKAGQYQGGVRGRERGDTISIYPDTLTLEESAAAGTLIHEVGHRVWRTLLNDAEQKDWTDGIRTSPPEVTAADATDFLGWVAQQQTPLGLDQLGAVAREQRLQDAIQQDGSLDEERREKYLMLLRESAGLYRMLDYGRADPDRRHEIVQEHLERVQRPANPERAENYREFLTEYAKKNTEEAFCEAMKLYLGKGPRAVPPYTRALLEKVTDRVRHMGKSDDAGEKLEKGGAVTGTIHVWKDGKSYQKQPDGEWAPVKERKHQKKKEETLFQQHGAGGAPKPGEPGFAEDVPLPAGAWDGEEPGVLAERLISRAERLIEDPDFAAICQLPGGPCEPEWRDASDDEEEQDWQGFSVEDVPDLLEIPYHGAAGEELSAETRRDLAEALIDTVQELRFPTGYKLGTAMSERERRRAQKKGRSLTDRDRWISEKVRGDYGEVPRWAMVAALSDALDPRRPIRLVNLTKEGASAFLAQHHSKLPKINERGLIYAIGAVRGGRLVAVATAGTPTGPHAHPEKILELTRVASDGTTKGAASALTARVLELLPRTGRTKLVTYQVNGEAGTTYSSLRDRGMRPTRFVKKRKRGGARRNSGDDGLAHLDKVRWEAGPDAAPAQWSLLERTETKQMPLDYQADATEPTRTSPIMVPARATLKRRGGAAAEQLPLFKSKLPTGTVHTWADGKQHQKQAGGDWKEVASQGPRQLDLFGAFASPAEPEKPKGESKEEESSRQGGAQQDGGASVDLSEGETASKRPSDKRFSGLDVYGYVRAGSPAAIDELGPQQGAECQCARCGARIGHVYLTSHGPMGGDCVATLTGDDATRALGRTLQEKIKRSWAPIAKLRLQPGSHPGTWDAVGEAADGRATFVAGVPDSRLRLAIGILEGAADERKIDLEIAPRVEQRVVEQRDPLVREKERTEKQEKERKEKVAKAREQWTAQASALRNVQAAAGCGVYPTGQRLMEAAGVGERLEKLGATLRGLGEGSWLEQQETPAPLDLAATRADIVRRAREVQAKLGTDGEYDAKKTLERLRSDYYIARLDRSRGPDTADTLDEALKQPAAKPAVGGLGKRELRDRAVAAEAALRRGTVDGRPMTLEERRKHVAEVRDLRAQARAAGGAAAADLDEHEEHRVKQTLRDAGTHLRMLYEQRERETSPYSKMPSKQIATVRDRLLGNMRRIADYWGVWGGDPNGPLNARRRTPEKEAEAQANPAAWEEQNRVYNQFKSLRDLAGREAETRRAIYDAFQTVHAAAEGVQTNKLTLHPVRVQDIMARQGDAYVDAGLIVKHTPGGGGIGGALDRARGKPPYSPDVFYTSDLTGQGIRHYVDLPNGMRVHPDELTEAQRRGRVIVTDAHRVPAIDWEKVPATPGEDGERPGLDLLRLADEPSVLSKSDRCLPILVPARATLARDDLEKAAGQGRGLPVGTVRTWTDGGHYQKQADGTWKQIADPRQASLFDLPEPPAPEPPKESEEAQQAREKAEQRAKMQQAAAEARDLADRLTGKWRALQPPTVEEGARARDMLDATYGPGFPYGLVHRFADHAHLHEHEQEYAKPSRTADESSQHVKDWRFTAGKVEQAARKKLTKLEVGIEDAEREALQKGVAYYQAIAESNQAAREKKRLLAVPEDQRKPGHAWEIDRADAAWRTADWESDKAGRRLQDAIAPLHKPHEAIGKARLAVIDALAKSRLPAYLVPYEGEPASNKVLRDGFLHGWMQRALEIEHAYPSKAGETALDGASWELATARYSASTSGKRLEQINEVLKKETPALWNLRRELGEYATSRDQALGIGDKVRESLGKIPAYKEAGEVRPESSQAIQHMIDRELSPLEKAAINAGGHTFVLAQDRRTKEGDWSTAQPRGWRPGTTLDNPGGWMSYSQHEIVVCESVRDSAKPTEIAWRTYHPDEMVQTMRHEAGHGLDCAHGDDFLSSSNWFLNAYKADLEALDQHPDKEHVRGLLSYGLQNGGAGPSEMFAMAYETAVSDQHATIPVLMERAPGAKWDRTGFREEPVPQRDGTTRLAYLTRFDNNASSRAIQEHMPRTYEKIIELRAACQGGADAYQKLVDQVCDGGHEAGLQWATDRKWGAT